MMIPNKKQVIVTFVFLFFVLSNLMNVVGLNTIDSKNLKIYKKNSGVSNSQYLTMEFNFSYPNVVTDGKHIWVYINESDMNMMIPDQPILPVNLTVINLPFGTEIIKVEYQNSSPIVIDLIGTLAHASNPLQDSRVPYLEYSNSKKNANRNNDTFPTDWISYHAAGGLSHGDHLTFFVNRVYPVRYMPAKHQLQFIENISVTIYYEEPEEPPLEDLDVYDLLIITPLKFKKYLQPLVNHKNEKGVKTKLVDLKEVYDEIFWEGRDNQEKIKHYIKKAIEYWGISHVLLIGGIKGQTFSWTIPVRYSHVVPPVEQEYAEPSFIADLYYADIYDYRGEFSSWDSNNDDVFSVWNDTYKEKMDLYPDVYLGRLACRNAREVKIMVNKIIQYEQKKGDDTWFKNLILVAGDSYPDINQFNEGELIAEQAIEYMLGFNPVKVYASKDDINRQTVNKAMNNGSGFAYFCGHGNPASWTTHFPPDSKNWTTGYKRYDMRFLSNGGKLPIVIVGGCHNAQFNVTFANLFRGIWRNGIYDYFQYWKSGGYGDYWKREWVPNCWAWELTSKKGGGAIATIANTGLGTHGEDDSDNNSIADYLEVLDGWLELRFLQLYGEDRYDNLGENHGDTLSEYLHRFLGNNEKMDVKMVQQWVLFGDPSLKIGGYS